MSRPILSLGKLRLMPLLQISARSKLPEVRFEVLLYARCGLWLATIDRPCTSNYELHKVTSVLAIWAVISGAHEPRAIAVSRPAYIMETTVKYKYKALTTPLHIESN